MKKIIVLIFLFLISCFLSPVYAIESPFSTPNNKIGVHILFTTEIDQAANLVNSNGGDWGYVTIPIQAGDRDIAKWQTFFNKCKELHVIPILRLATEGDYFNTKVWRKPTENDIVDFSNFLTSLQWPTKNRYVIIFNEPNRSDEWGGQASPAEYAADLEFAYDTFKDRSQDFFVISAGLDNAAADTETSYNEFTFLQTMQTAVPGVFDSIDGIGSHSYPNPGFSQPPSSAQEGVDTFAYEQSVIQSYTGKLLPIFITETGWSQNAVDDGNAADYLKQTFSTIWNNQYIIAITPFLLQNNDAFSNFSLLQNGNQTQEYDAIMSLGKVKGQPKIAEVIIAPKPTVEPTVVKKFNNSTVLSSSSISIPQGFKVFMKWLLHI